MEYSTAGVTFCMSCASSHSCSECMNASALSYTEDTALSLFALISGS